MKNIIKIISIVCFSAFVSYPAGASLYSDRSEVRQFIDDFVKNHQVNRSELLGLFRGVKQQKKALEAFAKPAERKLIWAEYKSIFLNQDRINGGKKFWQQHADILQRAEDKYGVPAEIIVAIIGVETKYGRLTGKFPVFETLTTLGFDADRRQQFFRSELEAFLLLARDEKMDPRVAKGSYAGAMGMPQFISSSYRQYAVDFDNDGQRDLWNSKHDVIGSVANYFKRHGWIKDGPVVFKTKTARVNKSTLAENAVGRGRKGLKPEKTLQYFSKLGLTVKSGLNRSNKATLLHFENKNSDEYWLGLKNFYVITRYNHSSMYAMAVYQLSQAIKAQYKKEQVVVH